MKAAGTRPAAQDKLLKEEVSLARRNKARLRLIPLGGLGEVGKNMLVVEYGESILLIDAGLMFPEEEMLGIDLVLPDFSYVVERAHKVVGVILTHGHEDHTGALPYLLREMKVPVYGTKLTLGLVQGKLAEHRIGKVKFKEIAPGKALQIGPFRLEFIWVSHSIPDGVAVVIDTPVGRIIHTGDFKFDQMPLDSHSTDIAKFASVASNGVLALLSDSTNAEVPGHVAPERAVRKVLENIFTDAKQRIIVASFASHIHRMQQVVDVAASVGRKIVIVGRSMVNNVAIAQELGYLKIPNRMVVDVEKMKGHDPAKIVVLSTGSQGEPLSALARMASREHRYVRIEKGDTVVISASPVPGNEKAVSRTIDRLFKAGAEVFYESVSGVHVSGHGAQEELRLMINLVKPKYFVPIHGEYRHLKYHAQLAETMGIDPADIFVLENGDVLDVGRNSAQVTDRIQAGMIFVDGLGVGDIGNVVLRDRQQLAQDGIFIVVVTINAQTGGVVARPELISRGFVYVREAKELIEEARERVEERLARTAAEHVTDWGVLKADVRNALSQFLYDETGRRPMILPVVVEV